MNQDRTDLKPANWQITATTIFCDRIKDEVTLMVYKDWTYRCAWYGRYKQKALNDKKSRFDNKINAKIQKCGGPDCPYITGYREKLLNEEFKSK
jgi:hypothetical protein